MNTVLDIMIKDYSTHAANLPVAMIPNCAATRHAHFVLDGSGPVTLDPPSLEDWPKLTYNPTNERRVDLDTVTREEIASFKPGETLLLNEIGRTSWRKEWVRKGRSRWAPEPKKKK